VWKNCGRVVQILWTTRQRKKISAGIGRGTRVRREPTAASRSASLDRLSRPRKIVAVRSRRTPFPDTTNVIVHRFEKTIGGRAYQIEVTAVNNRWRAQLRRLPGTPTALMPFYGPTPDEAADQLTEWLSLAHRRIRAVSTS
jgi:hypothetical protein